MIQGHGDDAYRYGRTIRANFSSNVFGRVDLGPLKAHLQERLGEIGHYPEPEPYTLEAALAARLGIEPAAVCVTNGATEAIYLIAHAFARSRSTILQPTFSEYADAIRLYWGAAPNPAASVCYSTNLPSEAELRVGFRDTSIFSASGTKTRSSEALFWLCNPNNPTGSVVPKAELTAAIEDNPDVVFIIDQSYGFFTQEPLLTASEAARFPNVIQLHSMTKRYAMPGLRLGYVTGAPQLLERIRAVRMPWSVNALAIEAGLYLCAHPDTAPIDLAALLAETERLRSRLGALPGLTAEPTRTHFFLCRLAKGRAAQLKDYLAREHGILIRDASNFEGLDAGHFRIATQTPAENDILVDAIRQYLGEGPAK